MGEDYKNLNINTEALESNAGRFKINRKLSKAIVTLIAVFSVLSFAGCTNTPTPEIPSTTAVGQSDPTEIDVNDVDLSGLVVALQKGEDFPEESLEVIAEKLSEYNISHIIAKDYDEMKKNLKLVDSASREIIAIRLGGEYNKTGQTVVMLDYYSGNDKADALALAFKQSAGMSEGFIDVRHGVDVYYGMRSSTRFETMIRDMKQAGELNSTVRPLSIVPSQLGDDLDTNLTEEFLAPAIVKFACLDQGTKDFDFYVGKEGSATRVGEIPPILKAKIVGTASQKTVG